MAGVPEQVALGNGLPATLVVLTPLDVVNAFAMDFGAAVDLRGITNIRAPFGLSHL